MAADKVYPHGALRELAENLWIVRGVSGMPLHRNMVVIRRPDGTLILHSVVALDDAGLGALTALGKPAVMIVPSASHQMDAPFYLTRFPDLGVVAPGAVRSALRPEIRVTAAVEETLPALGWTLHKVPGVKITEYVYEVPLGSGGRMLMFNDVLGGPNAYQNSIPGRLFVGPLTVPGNRFGIPRIFRWRMIEDMPALKRFVVSLSAIADVRLITTSHGDPVTESPAAALRAAAA